MVEKTRDSTDGPGVSGGATASNQVGDSGGRSDEHRPDVVLITINDKPFKVHRGRETVAVIKKLGGVPLADELAQVIAKNTPPLTPLPDDGAVTIKGGEVFVSYPKDSGSSHRTA